MCYHWFLEFVKNNKSALNCNAYSVNSELIDINEINKQVDMDFMNIIWINKLKLKNLTSNQ